MSIYVFALFSGVINLSLPLGIQAIVGIMTGGQVSTSWIVLIILVIAGIAFVGVLQIMQLTITENLQQKIFTRSAFEFAYRIPRFSLEKVDKLYVPELVNRFFDTLSVQKGLSKIIMDFSTATLQIIFGLILLSVYHPFFIMFSLMLLLFIFLIFRFTAARGMRTSLVESKYKYEVAHWLEELARAMGTFKLAGNTPLPLSKTNDRVVGYLKSRKEHFKTLRIQFINLVVFKVVVAAGLLAIGGMLVLNQQMNIGQFVAAEIIIILVLASVEKLITSMETIYDVLTALEKIGYVTDIPLEKDSGINPEMDEERPDKEGVEVNISQLTYSFPEGRVPVLKDINLHLRSGEKICLSGFNESGKSVLLQLIAALYDTYDGAITYNGIPLGNWNKEQLRNHIGDCLSKEDVFQGTIMENISVGKPYVTLLDVQHAAAVVGLDSFVETLKEGYNTMLISEGKTLPRSIRLKIMLARSIAMRPGLIMLEDNFNLLSLDDKKRFLDYVLDKDKPWSVIVVSNDSRVAERFNRVVIMKSGTIVEEINGKKCKESKWFNKVVQSC